MAEVLEGMITGLYSVVISFQITQLRSIPCPQQRGFHHSRGVLPGGLSVDLIQCRSIGRQFSDFFGLSDLFGFISDFSDSSFFSDFLSNVI